MTNFYYHLVRQIPTITKRNQIRIILFMINNFAGFNVGVPVHKRTVRRRFLYVRFNHLHLSTVAIDRKASREHHRVVVDDDRIAVADGYHSEFYFGGGRYVVGPAKLKETI